MKSRFSICHYFAESEWSKRIWLFSFLLCFSSLTAHIKPAQAFMDSEEPVTIDIMLLYSPGVTKLYGENVQVMIDHLVAIANYSLDKSDLKISLRKVHTQQVNSNDEDPSIDVLKRMTLHKNEFIGINAIRVEKKADMVVMMRPFVNDGLCGIAWVGGLGTQGDLSKYRDYMYSHVSVGPPCPPYALIHEIGHNLGLQHSRRQDPAGGTFPYSTGFGIDSVLSTIMAYEDAFNFAPKILRFSGSNTCYLEYVCGVDLTDPDQGSDARETLRTTAKQAAGFH